MKLSSLLNKDLIITGRNFKSQDEIISLFAEKFSSHYRNSISASRITECIHEREKLGSTVFDVGMAIPHGRLEGFDDLIIGICLPENPVMVENTEIRVFVIILSAKTNSTLYIQTLAAFSKIASDIALLRKLVSCRESGEITELLQDVRIKKEMTVEDVMSHSVISVQPDMTVKQLADIFYENNLGYAPVTGKNGELLGEVTMKELLKTAIPDYAEKVGNLNFLSNFEPLEHLLQNENRIRISEIMKKPDITLEKSNSIIEAAFKIAHGNRRHIPVVENGKIAGIISFTDLLRKVIRR